MSSVLFPALLVAGTVFVIGAISPGPSLAVVLRNTLAGGRRRGVACALGHGLGFGAYAMIAVFSLIAVLEAAEQALPVLRILGAAMLQVFAWLTWTNANGHLEAETDATFSSKSGFAEGATIAFLNPKIAVFMLAVLSQVLEPGMTLWTKAAIGALGMVIDTTWYVLVAVFLSSKRLENVLKRRSVALNRGLAVALAGLATWMLVQVFLG
ncbi:MAG: lysine transporter LysE [Euryarchaeota archaeon]|nr:lysine transporter LysE [Euryarchaeota archaeon]